MLKKIKKFLYSLLPFRIYLLCMHYGFFFLYYTGILYFSPEYLLHYKIKKIIKKDSNIIDVGANLGHYTFLFSYWTGRQGKVFAVEPINDFYRIIDGSFLKKKNVHLYNFALSNKKACVNMGIVGEFDYFRTGLPKILGNDDINNEKIDILSTVDTEKGDDVFDGLSKIDYIKIDVEGHEMEVLEGFSFLIKKFRPILQVEVRKNNLSCFFQKMQSWGYNIFYFKDGSFHKLKNLSFHLDADLICSMSDFL